MTLGAATRAIDPFNSHDGEQCMRFATLNSLAELSVYQIEILGFYGRVEESRPVPKLKIWFDSLTALNWNLLTNQQIKFVNRKLEIRENMAVAVRKSLQLMWASIDKSPKSEASLR